MFLRSFSLLLLFGLLLATVTSMGNGLKIVLDKMQLDSENSLIGMTNDFMERTKQQEFTGYHRYRRESSGDGDYISTLDNQPLKDYNIEDASVTQIADANDSQPTTIIIVASSDSTTSSEFDQINITNSDTATSTSLGSIVTETNTQNMSESSDSVLSRTTDSFELISPTAVDLWKDKNLTVTCNTNSAYVQFIPTDSNHTSIISSYKLTVEVNNNYTIIMDGDNWLTCNITNLSSRTRYTFTVNAEYGNSSSLIGTVNCTTSDGSTELNWFTITGCGVSIFWLVVSLMCFCCIRRIQGPRNNFHVNLCVNLAIANGTILASVFYEEEIKSANSDTVLGIPCFVMPIVIHYGYLTSLTWIGLEILYIYRSLVVVFFKPKNPLILTYVIGYILPAFVIAFCMLLNYTYFNVGSIYGTNNSCWVAGSVEIALILLSFVLLILLFNIIMFIVSSKAISSIKLRHESRFMIIIAKRSSKWLCHLLILHPFLGSSWFLGFLQFGKWKIAPVLFAVVVSLQSFLIFLMHVVLDVCIQKQIRHEDRDSVKATEMADTTAHVDHVIASPVTHDEFGISVHPPPYTLVITGDGHPFEQQDLLPKKRRSLKGKKYSWNVSSTRTSVNTDNSKSGPTQFAGATFKPSENSTLL